MRFCREHWDKLREAIDQRGLSSLVAPDGETATAQLADQATQQRVTAANFDPLMHAHWAIISNVGDIIGDSMLYVMGDGPEDIVDRKRYRRAKPHQRWPRCPLCYVNLVHELTCKGCDLDRRRGFDYMTDRAADDALELARKLGLR